MQAGGSFPDGRTYDGPDQFKKLLTEDLDRFAESFIEQLATYALRRALTIDDAPHIRAIAAASKQDDYRLRTLIQNFVTSPRFRQR